MSATDDQDNSTQQREQPTAPPPYAQDPPTYGQNTAPTNATYGQPAAPTNATYGQPAAQPYTREVGWANVPSAPPPEERPSYLPGAYPATITYQPQPQPYPYNQQYYSYYRPMPASCVQYPPKNTVYLVHTGRGEHTYAPVSQEYEARGRRDSDEMDFMKACCATTFCAACLSCLLLNAH